MNASLPYGEYRHLFKPVLLLFRHFHILSLDVGEAVLSRGEKPVLVLSARQDSNWYHLKVFSMTLKSINHEQKLLCRSDVRYLHDSWSRNKSIP